MEERERRVRGESTATALTKRNKEEEEGGGFPRRETFVIALESIACMVLPRELSELASVANGGGNDLDEHFITNIPSYVHIVTF